MIQLDKQYEPGEVEKRWGRFWEEKNFFHADETSKSSTYSIVIPTPNITGRLHIGHAFNNTLQDILTRWKRMQGFNVLWQPGTDHAGIATQNVVEKQLHQEGATRQDLGRENFVERVWKWRSESGGVLISQLKKLGCSLDWERDRFTMDEGLSKAVREVFVTLYEEGLIYKGDYIINWCPRCYTALSDLEVEYQETQGYLYHLKYSIKETDGFIVIATTRPETMLGDTAVAVNPDDNRYQQYKDKKLILPIVNREIPLIQDRYVDTAFGTGALKVTPAHDQNDFELGQRHQLETINVMNPDGTMNSLAGSNYQGLDRFECRKKLVNDLKGSSILVKTEELTHSVGHCYRCRAVVEPYLSKQWFVKAKPLAEPALKAVRDGSIKIVPKFWENTYFEWMENIRDWCISRQIWWGHQIPAWNCKACGKVIVSRKTPNNCPDCSSNELIQETDVLDTWFSSALWPFSTLGWPENTESLKLFYPTSVLCTGFDILFFWVARMIMMGLKFMGDVPFRDVYIHALIRDAEGQKMSKTKGNVIDPLEVMERYGTDALRFTLAAFAAQGRDIKLAEDRIEGYRNFCNKLWNASRFVLMNLEGYKGSCVLEEKASLSNADRWILSRLNRASKEVNETLEAFRFNDAALTVYKFIWNEYCDWYIELTKPRLTAPGQERVTAQNVLIHVLDSALKLLHPFMPFITEEIWQKLPQVGKSIMVSGFPEYRESQNDEVVEKEMQVIMEIITGIRNIRGEMNLNPGLKLNALVRTQNLEIQKTLKEQGGYIRDLARVEELKTGSNIEKPKMSASSVLGEMDLIVPLEGMMDFQEERNRVEKELKKIEKDLIFLGKKLSNPNFVKKAPAEVIEKDEHRKASLSEKQAKLENHLKTIEQALC